MNREKKLIFNILVFAAGNLGSKLLQFILVPFYTAVLNTEEYGVVDILQTGSMLLVPIFSLTIAESVFRYGMDKSSDKKSVFSAGISIVSVGSMLLFLLGTILTHIWGVEFQGMNLMLMYSVVSMYRNITSQFLRAIGKVRLFSVDSVIQTLSIIGFNLLFLLKYDLGVTGYMMGYILGNTISIAFGFFAGKLWTYFKLAGWDKKLIKQMLLFSIPLIPNTICWWISSSTDRLMIISYIGNSANGLYSIAHKVPSMINIVISIFISAWQISANEEFDKQDRSEFYSKIYEYLVFLSFAVSSFLMLFAKVIIRILSNESYYDAWSIMIFLILGMVYFSFASFLGTIYTANKKTSMAFLTNLLAAIVNVVLNFFIIPVWGADGAAFTTCISYVVFWIVRLVTTQKIVKIKSNYSQMIVCSICIVVQVFVQLLEVKYWMVWAAICMFIIVAKNYKIIRGLIEETIKMVKSKKGMSV